MLSELNVNLINAKFKNTNKIFSSTIWAFFYIRFTLKSDYT